MRKKEEKKGKQEKKQNKKEEYQSADIRRVSSAVYCNKQIERAKGRLPNNLHSTCQSPALTYLKKTIWSVSALKSSNKAI